MKAKSYSSGVLSLGVMLLISGCGGDSGASATNDLPPLSPIVDPTSAAAKIINVDFGTGDKTTMAGKAVVGNEDSDLWNFFSSSTSGISQMKSFTMKLIDTSGADSGASLILSPVTLKSASNGHRNPMYSSYVVSEPVEMLPMPTVLPTLALAMPKPPPQLVSMPIHLSIKELKTGKYSLFLFGHGAQDNENAAFSVSVVGLEANKSVTTDLGTKSTISGKGWDAETFTEGKQFVSFRGISINSEKSDQIKIDVMGGASFKAVVSGFQLIKE